MPHLLFKKLRTYIKNFSFQQYMIINEGYYNSKIPYEIKKEYAIWQYENINFVSSSHLFYLFKDK